MPIKIDEVTAGRLERVAPRAFRLFGGAAAAATGGALESTDGGVQQSSTSGGLPNQADARAIAEALKRDAGQRAVAGGVAGRDINIEADAIAAQLVARANEVLAQLRGGGSPGEVSADGAYALESVMRVRGRPAPMSKAIPLNRSANKNILARSSGSIFATTLKTFWSASRA